MIRVPGLKAVALVSVLFFTGLTGYTLTALLDLQDELAVDLGENMVWAAGQATYQAGQLYQASQGLPGSNGARANPALQLQLLRARLKILLAPTQVEFMRQAGVLEEIQQLEVLLDAEPPDYVFLQSKLYDVGRRIMQVERELAGARRDTYGSLMRQLIVFVLGGMVSGVALFVLLLGSMWRTRSANAEISRQHAQAQELLSALERERQVRDRYRNFVSLMSHQLRTPLAVIDSSAQRLVRSEGADLAITVAGRTQRIRRAVRQLNQLISRVLQGLKVDEQGRNAELGLELARWDWADVLQQSLDSFGDLLNERPIDVQWLNPDKPPLWVECDRLWCAEIMTNLISNADKYSPVGQPILIRIEQRDQLMHCQVLDHGPGIPEQDLDALFTPFFRGSNGRNTMGVGLGLSISRTLAEWHQGRTSVSNRAEGGACFELCLPIQPHID